MCPAYSLTLNHISQRVEGVHISFRFHSQVPALKTALRTKLSRAIGFAESSHLTVQTAYFGWDETSIHLLITIILNILNQEMEHFSHLSIRYNCYSHKPKTIKTTINPV